MLESLDSTEIDLPCPKCGHKTKKSIGWIKNNSDFTCPCGTVIKLDASDLKSEVADVERSLSDLQSTIKGLNTK